MGLLEVHQLALHLAVGAEGWLHLHLGTLGRPGLLLEESSVDRVTRITMLFKHPVPQLGPLGEKDLVGRHKDVPEAGGVVSEVVPAHLWLKILYFK